jgi:hypothetical protein
MKFHSPLSSQLTFRIYKIGLLNQTKSYSQKDQNAAHKI